MTLDKPTLQWVISELETFKRCDPYTGELYDSELNTTLEDAIQWFREEGELHALLKTT